MSYGGRKGGRERKRKKIGLKGVILMENSLMYAFGSTVCNVIVVPIIPRKKLKKLGRTGPWAQLRPR